MDRRSFLGFGLTVTLAAAALGACGGPEIRIVRQAMPDPLLNVRSYALAPITWQNFTYNGQSEADWLASRPEQRQRDSWAVDKVAVTEKFLRRLVIEKNDSENYSLLQGTPPPGTFIVAINVDSFDHGRFNWTLRVLDAAGQVVDEVQPPARGGGFGLAMQLNSLTVYGAVDVVKYMRTRYAPEG